MVSNHFPKSRRTMDALPVQFRVEYYVTLLAEVCHFIIPVDKKMKSTGCCCGNHMRSKICVAQKNVNKARPLFLLCAITYFLFLFFISLGLWDSCPCALFVSSFDFFHALSLAVMPFFPFCFLFCFSSQESLWYFIVLWN